MPDFKSVDIVRMVVNEAHDLAVLFHSADPEYSKYFTPFSFDEETLRNMLLTAVKDQFFSIKVNNRLSGFYMLRGFDEGYQIPSYGVWIAPEYAGCGLAKLSLQHAICFCKVNRVKKLMLKVAQENTIPKKIYEDFGFIQQGFDERNNNLIYYKELFSADEDCLLHKSF
jgi:RimJ/RimL family protein N-acetyltransferase